MSNIFSKLADKLGITKPVVKPPEVKPDLPTALKFSGDHKEPTITFDETASPLVGSPATKTWLVFQPLEKGTGNAPFTFHQAVTKYEGVERGDEVFMFGWNLNEGGGPRNEGEPGIGNSYEQHYIGLTEHHLFWIDPKTGKQVRLFSFTINNATSDIDFYNIVNRHYQKDIAGNVWHGIHHGEKGEVLESFIGPGFSYQWTYDAQGIQLTGSAEKPFFFRGPLYVEMPGGSIFHQKYVQFDKPVTFTGPVTFKQKVIFEQGFENRRP